MSTHDLNIANQTAANARADINSALQALGSNSSNATAPATTFANMHWYDTSSNTLKQRSEADDAWISIGYFDQTSNSFKVFDDTMVVNTSGVQTGLIGDQATSVWQAGTGTTESLVSPAKVKEVAKGSYSLSESGYQVFPSGLYMQWGRVTGVNAAQNKTVTLPIAFPNNFWVINGTPLDNRASGDFEVDFYSVACKPLTLSTFSIINEGTSSGSNQTMMFMALGN
tara:strand:+ start:3096 stop:3773 length:678 start_codon:yes stop_codon:yes gene_type:complete